LCIRIIKEAIISAITFILAIVLIIGVLGYVLFELVIDFKPTPRPNNKVQIK